MAVTGKSHLSLGGASAELQEIAGHSHRYSWKKSVSQMTAHETEPVYASLLP